MITGKISLSRYNVIFWVTMNFIKVNERYFKISGSLSELRQDQKNKIESYF